MIIAYPTAWIGADQKPGKQPFPWLGWVLTFTIVLCFIADHWWLQLPPWLQQPTQLLAYGRLYTDPQQGLFAFHQVWTHVLFTASWWQLIPIILLLPHVLAAFTARVGTPVGILLGSLLAPLTVSVHLMVGRAIPDPGMSAVLVGYAGALFALAPRLRLRWHIAWFLIVRFGTWRLSTGLVSVLLVFIAQDFIRLAVAHILNPDLVPSTYLISHALSVTLAGIGGYLLAQSLLLPGSVLGEKPGQRVAGIASGERPLHELEEALLKDDVIPMDRIEQVAQRCMHEQAHDAAQVLATYLGLRDPDNPTYRQLRQFLGTDPTSTNIVADQQAD